MINYQDIKIFNKNGYEIPLLSTSNIIFTDASDLTKISDDNVVLYGYYDGNNKELFNAKIINHGKFTAPLNSLQLNCFIDGYIIDNIATINNLTNSDYQQLYFTNGENTNMSSSSNSANDEGSCVYYSLKNINNLQVNCDLSDIDDLLFPSAIFFGNIEIEPVSVGLVETETLIIGKIEDNNCVNIVTDNSTAIKLIIDKNDEDIDFITANELTDEITRNNEAIISANSDNYVNIGFFPKQEGVHESIIWVCISEIIDGEEQLIKIGQLNVHGVAIGYDERYNAIFENFGIMNPKTYYSIFKEHNIHEENPDWKMINEKSKELFLSYSEIFPYIGTYKALINAVNFLGYDDIYFREWFKMINDPNNKEVSYKIDLNNLSSNNNQYNNIDTNYKKLNKLTMVYKLNQETGEYDKDELPIINNVYQYSITEILTKLIALKEWLERNIIAVNCKILDITGEGIVYERTDHIAYGTIMQNLEHEDTLEMHPYVKNKITELVDGSANIEVGNLISSELKCIKLSDLNNMSIGDISENDATIEYPFISDFMIKATIDTSNAIISDNVTKPLWINNNDLNFLKIKDVQQSDVFYYANNSNENVLINDDNVMISKVGNFIEHSSFINPPIIHLQRAYLKEDIIGWNDHIKYTITPDITKRYSYMLINEDGITEFSHDNIILYPDYDSSAGNPSLEYTLNNAYGVPMFKIKNYKFILYNTHSRSTVLDAFCIGNEGLILDIQDGKIINPIINNKRCVINFHYDNEVMNKQSVSAIYEYRTTHDYNPQIDHSTNRYFYNEFATLNVNNIGHYDIMVYAFNDNGNVFCKSVNDGVDVIMKKADINIYSDVAIYKNEYPFHPIDSIGELVNIDLTLHDKELYDDKNPLFRNNYRISELLFGGDINQRWIKYPNVSYAYSLPENGDYIHLNNVVDKFECVTYNTSNNNFTFRSLADKQFNIFPKCTLAVTDSKLNLTTTVNVIVYNNIFSRGIYEMFATVNSQNYTDERFTISLNVTNDEDAKVLKSYIDSNDYTYDFYIIPTTLYKVKSVDDLGNQTRFTLDNMFDNANDKIGNSNNVFDEGDCVKIIYSINKYKDDNLFVRIDEIDNDSTEEPSIYDGIEHNIKYYPGIDQYLDNNGNRYLKIFRTDNLSNSRYSGYATYKVKNSNNLEFITNDKFNYKEYYNIQYLLGEIDQNDSYDDIDSNIKAPSFNNRYIIRYNYEYIENINDEQLLPVVLKNERTITINDNTYSYDSITTDLCVAKAHQAYVQYKLQCNSAKEYFNSYTKIFTKNNRLYDYLDKSFSFILSKFDIENAFKYWDYDYKQPSSLYMHNNPITICASKKYEKLENITTSNKVVLTSKFNNQPKNYTYWKLYKQDVNNKTRKLMFEVLNDKLFLKIPYTGIYDIEAYNYDIYGNLSKTDRIAYIYVK